MTTPANSGRARRRARLGPGLVAAALLAAAGCGAPDSGAPGSGPAAQPLQSLAAQPSDPAPRVATAAPAAEAAAVRGPELSRGFLVWESNRSGEWRLWVSDLDGGQAWQLTADERGRSHCCPHIAPGGELIAYLSLPKGRARYLDEDAVGELRSIGRDGSAPRELAPEARTYFEHRAVVWVDDTTLHYIGGDGGVRRLDTATGAVAAALDPTGDLARRWLVDASGRWAATGRGALAPVARGRLGAETLLPGCQPYFSHDSRWAFWTAGAGGPIDRFDLEAGETATILRKNDPRLPADRGYLYFPMLSRDGSLLAFAASGGAHDHHRADYDVFLAEVDRETLELRGKPRVMAPHPAVDRFPDVWRPASAAPASDGATEAASPAGPRRATWPATTDGLLWAWSAAGEGPTTQLLRDGAAVDPRRALDLSAGPVVARGTAELLHDGLYGTNQFSLELVLTPPRRAGGQLGAILALSRDSGRENLVLGQRGGRLVMRMRVGPKGRDAFDEADLGPLRAGERTHLLVTYSPGRLAVFRDGRQTLASRDLLGHFFHWKPYSLTLGDRGRGDTRWEGRLDALAVYDRPLEAEEARANADLAIGRRSAQ